MTFTHSTPTTAGVLDAGALGRLRELDPTGANRLLERVATAFLSSIERLMPELEAASHTAPNFEVIRRIAHALKSSAASIGGIALSHRCAEIEQLAFQGRADGLTHLLEGMQTDLEQVRVALKLLLAESESR